MLMMMIVVVILTKLSAWAEILQLGGQGAKIDANDDGEYGDDYLMMISLLNNNDMFSRPEIPELGRKIAPFTGMLMMLMRCWEEWGGEAGRKMA